MAAISFSHSQQTTDTSWSMDFSINILNSDEEQLVSKAKRKVLKEWRIWMSTKPRLNPTLDLIVKVYTRVLPYLQELLCHFLYFNVVHRISNLL